jgi:hypothetical protein
VIDQYRLTAPLEYRFIAKEKIDGPGNTNWRRVSSPAKARALWDAEVAKLPEFLTRDLHLITGAVLPIWDRLSGSPKIYRLLTETGERLLGRVIPNEAMAATLEKLGAEKLKVTEDPAQIAAKVLAGAVATLANGWSLKRALVAGEPRLELVGPEFSHLGELRHDGAFTERIQFRTRCFVPTGATASGVIAKITAGRPVVSIADTARSSSGRFPDAEDDFPPVRLEESAAPYIPDGAPLFSAGAAAPLPASVRLEARFAQALLTLRAGTDETEPGRFEFAPVTAENALRHAFAAAEARAALAGLAGAGVGAAPTIGALEAHELAALSTVDLDRPSMTADLEDYFSRVFPCVTALGALARAHDAVRPLSFLLPANDRAGEDEVFDPSLAALTLELRPGVTEAALDALLADQALVEQQDTVPSYLFAAYQRKVALDRPWLHAVAVASPHQESAGFHDASEAESSEAKSVQGAARSPAAMRL